MFVNSTELQNNFGKYLQLAGQEDIYITRNGIPMAKLTRITEGDSFILERAQKYSSVTYQQFLELTADSPERYELIDGVVYLLSSPRTAHQSALVELTVLFHQQFKGLGCSVFVAPYDITIRRNAQDDFSMVQPDMMVICDLEQHLQDGKYMGVPRLVVEILSPSTRSKDKVKKLDLYMDCGVEEYWLVDPEAKEITIYSFKDKEIHKDVRYRSQDIASSFAFPGLTVALPDLFA